MESDIYPMTGRLTLQFAQTSVANKAGPWAYGPPWLKAGDIRAARAGDVDFACIKTLFSLGFRWNS